jgi:uncharacterized protein DUF930
MQHYKKPWIGWGALASLALHLSVASLLLFRLAEALPNPPEEAIKVEVVPPAPPKPPEKTENKPAESKPQPAPPPSPPAAQAFESAMAKTDEKVSKPQLPPAAQDTPEVADSAPDDGSAAKSEEKPAANKVFPETKPDQPKLSLPETNTGTEPRKLDEPAAQKPARDGEEKDRGSKQATAKRETNNPVRAKELFSPNSLADPRVKQAIGNLSTNERVVQLCKIEALDQIRRQRPDSDLLAYSPSKGIVSNRGLDANGVAFRTRTNWYNVNFKCQVNAAATKVVSFSYVIGNAVPKSEWTARGLILD